MANLLSVCPYFVMPIVRGSGSTQDGRAEDSSQDTEEP
jgi:hypothetical protein